MDFRVGRRLGKDDCLAAGEVRRPVRDGQFLKPKRVAGMPAGRKARIMASSGYLKPACTGHRIGTEGETK